jgi:5-methylcytosine-specific restriction protein A
MERAFQVCGGTMARNPAWTDEEIILATEVYVRADGRVLGPKHPDVIRLSEVLNSLPIHSLDKRNEAFRNPSGIGMKLSNIRAADPDREGGSPHGSQRDGLFWDELQGDESRLFDLATQIKQKYRALLRP